MSLAKARVPAAAVSGVVGLLVGVVVGIVLMGFYDGRWDPKPQSGTPDGPPPAAAMGGGMMGGPPGGGRMGGPPGGGMGGPPGGMMGGGPGGGRGPGPKAQLAQLVGKLDVLTKKPLTVQLTPEQKRQAKDLLAGLDGKAGLTDEEAQKTLDGLLKLVEGQREALEAAGFRWPGQAGGGRPMGTPPNPFEAEENKAHLRSLQATLGG